MHGHVTMLTHVQSTILSILMSLPQDYVPGPLLLICTAKATKSDKKLGSAWERRY